MKAAVRALRLRAPLTSSFSNPCSYSFLRLYSAQPDQPPYDDDAVFDSSHFDVDIGGGGGFNPNSTSDDKTTSTTWDHEYRDRVKSKVFGEDVSYSREREKELEKKKSEDVSNLRRLERELEKKKRAGALAKSFIGAADDINEGYVVVDPADVKEEDQKSLSVGIFGPPNAGKSALTNYISGTKVSAVSRKVNTTTHEVLGVLTQGATQICFFDTPGVMLKKYGIPYRDMSIRSQSAWTSMDLFDVLILVFDVHRHITRPDSRVVRLIHRIGSMKSPNQKRILCMNKVDLVPKTKDLLGVAKEFSDLPGYDKQFLISGLKGAGVKDVTRYLVEQSVKRPWDEDPFVMSEEVMKSISLEVVREKLLDHVHQEIPYGVEHRLVGWKELRDGSLRIEQHFVTPKLSQRRILIGSKGSKIRTIGIEANQELRSIFQKKVHLVINVLAK